MKKRNFKKLEQVITAWETVAREERFAEMTLEEFKAKAQPLLDVQARLAHLENQVTETMLRLKTASREGGTLATYIVNSVKGHPNHGEDSPLYGAMGYVRRSDRRSGLTRKGIVTLNATKTPDMLKAA